MTSAIELEQKRLVELEEAFELFNQTSSQLTFAYESLQNQVEDLQNKLVASNIEKQQVGDRLEQLLNLLPAAVIVLDLEEIVIDMNPAAIDILGEDAKGRPWEEIIRNVFLTRNDAGTFLTHCQKAYQLSESFLTSPDKDKKPTLIGRILLLQNITDARNLQLHKDRHQRLSSMGEMTASLAHQIRTPLASALLYVSQLNSADLMVDKRQKFVDKSIASLRHLENLVQDMLQYAKGGKSICKPVKIDDLIKSLLNSIEARVVESDCLIMVTDFNQDLCVMGDVDALQTALQNLVINAINIVKKGMAEVTIEVEKMANKINIKVSDNGPGVAEDMLEKIFEPFYTSRAQGTGLGLSVVRAVAEDHDGEVWVKTIKGEGATFALRLPLYQTEDTK